MIKYIIIFSLLAIGLTSCFKEDDPIQPHPKSGIEQEVIPLTEYYVYQVYFNLATGEQVSSNYKNAFDLSFACDDTATAIRLNTSTFMKAAKTQSIEFDQVADTIGLVWKFDKSDGNPDSTAFVDWIKIEGTDTVFTNTVYVIDRGIDEEGFSLGLKKVIFRKIIQNKYYFTYANMDNSEQKDVVVEKNPGYNYTQFSFENGGEVKQVEPKTDNWDLLFTQYTTLLYTNEGDPYPYLVTGTLVNPAGTEVAFDSTMTFQDVVLDDVYYLDYLTNTDVIGYEWKELHGDINGSDFYYQTKSNFNFFIKSKQGIFYKLHFTGFYDTETGVKGYPTFEYQRL
jgi:hypothetical protein